MTLNVYTYYLYIYMLPPQWTYLFLVWADVWIGFAELKTCAEEFILHRRVFIADVAEGC